MIIMRKHRHVLGADIKQIDRTNIGNARIQGMEKDLHLQGYRFNWVLTTFYIAYTIVEIPSNIVLKKIGAKIWLPILTVCFGIVCVGTAFTKTFAQLIFLRFLLGLTEGGMMPGTSYYLSCFYKRDELLFRIGVFATSASLAGAFGGLLATGLTKIPKWGSEGSELHTWRNIFFFEGFITIIVGMIAPKFLPRHPGDCKFLNDKEKMIALQRLAIEHDVSPTIITK
jgi:MFS family permease